jgi:hypothetical protein
VITCPGLDPGTIEGAATIRHHLSRGRAVYIPAPVTIRNQVKNVEITESDLRSIGVSPETKVSFFGNAYHFNQYIRR